MPDASEVKVFAEIAYLRTEINGLRDTIIAFGNQLAGAQERLKIFTELFEKEQAGAARYRQDLRISMAAGGEATRNATALIQTQTATIEQLKKKTDELEKTIEPISTAYAQGVGAAKLGKFMWVGLIAIGSMVLTLAAGIAGLITYLLRH